MNEIYGPNTELVERFIERCKKLTKEEIEIIATWVAAWDATWVATWVATWDAARVATWDAARVAARVATWDAARVAAWVAARVAAWDAAQVATWDAARVAAWVAQAIVVIDLITDEQFTILSEPFAEILVELDIKWVAK